MKNYLILNTKNNKNKSIENIRKILLKNNIKGKPVKSLLSD
jgi:hypothetical protein